MVLVYLSVYLNLECFAEKFDADYRDWGGGHWIQNIRQPYYAFLASGDWALGTHVPFFNLISSQLPLARARTQAWFGHGGAFAAETMFLWGTCESNFEDAHFRTHAFVVHTDEDVDYGCGTRLTASGDPLPSWWMSNSYIRWHRSSTLELATMMMDYYEASLDAVFAKDVMVPFINETLKYYQQHYLPFDGDNKIILTPASGLETYQSAVNPSTEVGGLVSLCLRVAALPNNPVPTEVLSAASNVASVTPRMPIGPDPNTGQTTVLPAEATSGLWLGNSENVSRYTSFCIVVT